MLDPNFLINLIAALIYAGGLVVLAGTAYRFWGFISRKLSKIQALNFVNRFESEHAAIFGLHSSVLENKRLDDPYLGVSGNPGNRKSIYDKIRMYTEKILSDRKIEHTEITEFSNYVLANFVVHSNETANALNKISMEKDKEILLGVLKKYHHDRRLVDENLLVDKMLEKPKFVNKLTTGRTLRYLDELDTKIPNPIIEVLESDIDSNVDLQEVLSSRKAFTK